MDFMMAGVLGVLLGGLKAALALGVVWATLRTFDVLAGVTFKDGLLSQIMDGNMSLAVYCGCRFLGACILGGLTFIIPL